LKNESAGKTLDTDETLCEMPIEVARRSI
jgi:hypothetical protein